uniref:Protein kinase domain-containing protein n=1 Tax=Palpitomonas bilix TaxID=652834 RepID=A0A7S3GKV5_9EUKA
MSLAEFILREFENSSVLSCSFPAFNSTSNATETRNFVYAQPCACLVSFCAVNPSPPLEGSIYGVIQFALELFASVYLFAVLGVRRVQRRKKRAEWKKKQTEMHTPAAKNPNAVRDNEEGEGEGDDTSKAVRSMTDVGEMKTFPVHEVYLYIAAGYTILRSLASLFIDQGALGGKIFNPVLFFLFQQCAVIAPVVYLLQRSWGGKALRVSALVAFGVSVFYFVLQFPSQWATGAFVTESIQFCIFFSHALMFGAIASIPLIRKCLSPSKSSGLHRLLSRIAHPQRYALFRITLYMFVIHFILSVSQLFIIAGFDEFVCVTHAVVTFFMFTFIFFLRWALEAETSFIQKVSIFYMHSDSQAATDYIAFTSSPTDVFFPCLKKALARRRKKREEEKRETEKGEKGVTSKKARKGSTMMHELELPLSPDEEHGEGLNSVGGERKEGEMSPPLSVRHDEVVISAEEDANARRESLDVIKSKLLVDLTEFSLEYQIGRGATGEVYRGWLRGSEVAAKQMYSEVFDESQMKSVLHEAVVLSKLYHPNILRFLGVNFSPPHVVIFTEYCSSGDLQQFLMKYQGKIGEDKALKMLTELASGMCYLHSRRPALIHKDLKSANILLTLRGLKICDFDLAERVKSKSGPSFRETLSENLAGTGGRGNEKRERRLTLSGTGETVTKGTVRWTAPEVLESGGRAHSVKSDVYSFGVVAFEIVTATYSSYKLPFDQVEGGFDHKVEEAVIAGEKLVFPDAVPAALRVFIQQTTSSNPQDRPDFEAVRRALSSLTDLATEGNLDDIGSLDGSG